jgi:hypothetical protein
MGFGWLFIGYFLGLFLDMSPVGVFTRVVGYAVIYYALSVLRLYCRSFRYAQYVAIPLMLVAIYRTFSDVSSLFSVSFPFLNQTLTGAANVAYMCLMVLFHVLLAISIRELCLRTGVNKNAIRAVQNMVMVIVYAILQLWVPRVPEKLHGVFYGLTLLMQLLSTICNLVLLYSCYARICPAGEGSGEKPLKPSRWAFVNDLRQRYRQSEEKAIREDRAYRAEKLQKKLQKQPDKKVPKKENRASKRAEVKAAREAARKRHGE